MAIDAVAAGDGTLYTWSMSSHELEVVIYVEYVLFSHELEVVYQGAIPFQRLRAYAPTPSATKSLA